MPANGHTPSVSVLGSDETNTEERERRRRMRRAIRALNEELILVWYLDPHPRWKLPAARRRYVADRATRLSQRVRRGCAIFAQMSRNISCLRSNLACRLSALATFERMHDRAESGRLRAVTCIGNHAAKLQFYSALRLPHSTSQTRVEGTHSSLADSPSRGQFSFAFLEAFCEEEDHDFVT